MIKISENKRAGFSLVELLVAVGILVVLLGLSLVSLSGSRRSARDARRRVDLEDIRGALEMYRSDCGEYPANDYQSGQPINGDGTLGCPAVSVYITLPHDPASNGAAAVRRYLYRNIDDDNYRLCAALEGTGSVGNCGVLLCGTTLNCNHQVLNP
ncbi:type II secretion system protein [Patescibacteria group bacterium]